MNKYIIFGVEVPEVYIEQIYNVSCLAGVFAEKYLSRDSRIFLSQCTCTCTNGKSLCLQNNKGDFWLFINDD
jgi:hypothetical protein